MNQVTFALKLFYENCTQTGLLFSTVNLKAGVICGWNVWDGEGDDMVRLSRWTQPHSRWQSCCNVCQARFR